MGDPKPEEQTQGLLIMIVGILLVLNFVYPGTGIIGLLMFLGTLVAIIWLIKGVFSFGKSTNPDPFAAGVALIMIFLLFFNGTGVVQGTFNFVGAIRTIEYN